MSFIKLVRPLGALLLMGSLLVGCVAQTSTEPVATPAATQPVATPATPAPIVPTEMPTEMPTELPVEEPTSEPVPPIESTPADGQASIVETGTAVVETIEVRLLESFPVQVQAVLTGYVPDGCTTIAGTEVVSAGTTFRIRMTTERPEDAICTQAIVGFEEVVPIDVTGYPAASYEVRVNDLSATFELP